MALPPEQIRALDQLRQRLSQLSQSLASARADLERSDPVPSWPTLQRDAELLVHNLNRYHETMNEHRAFLTAAHAYPLPTFPGPSQEHVLAQLMRKKLEPKAEDWIAASTKPKTRDAAQLNGLQNGDTSRDVRLDREEYRDLWKWAGATSSGIANGMMINDAFEDNYTLAEREAGVENVVTGLKRNLDDDSDDEDEDGEGDEKMQEAMPSKPAEPGVDASRPPIALETLLRFTSTGTLPPQR
ncbi:hypothetical protein LTR36_002819 [Oleoguttula mirabilis]|uniref:Mediator of RNA polymerase II transcription subunit 8 n=1 Tax=Oleoguttula mirabilis TaxID=1507867 RepID=A0AAV9JJP4_9PEZI|nr:hypothetical protein LTR36_002819 [Oleoguttula mirabilis]